MMKTIGKIGKAEMAEMQRRGAKPQDAVQAIIAEAKLRHPDANIILHRNDVGGFDVVAL